MHEPLVDDANIKYASCPANAHDAITSKSASAAKILTSLSRPTVRLDQHQHDVSSEHRS